MKKSEVLVFVVEDDEMFKKLIKNKLEKEGFNNIKCFSSIKDLLLNIDNKPRIIILDYMLEDGVGSKVVEEVNEFKYDVEIIAMSGQQSIDTAVSLMNLGVKDYIVKNHMAISKLEEAVQLAYERIEHKTEQKKQEMIKNLLIYFSIFTLSLFIGYSVTKFL